MMLVVGLSHFLVQADELTNNSTNPIKKVGGYSMKRGGPHGGWVFTNPSEFWY
jgi:hypothetical protein